MKELNDIFEKTSFLKSYEIVDILLVCNWFYSSFIHITF